MESNGGRAALMEVASEQRLMGGRRGGPVGARGVQLRQSLEQEEQAWHVCV